MTQYGYEPLSPEVSGSTLLARVNGVVPALLTNHKGAARPAYVQPGMLWIDGSGATWLLNLFDGTSDVPIAKIDPETHALVSSFVPLTRKLKIGSGLLLDGVAGSDAEPADADLSADRLLGIDLAAKALSPELWGAGVATTEAPISPAKLAAAIVAKAPFTKSWQSPEISLVQGGAFNVSHTLGVAPEIIQAFLICKTAENGFSIGGVTPVPNHYQYNGGHDGVALDVSSSTKISGKFSSAGLPFSGINPSTGASFNFTLANWRLILRAYA